MAVSRWRISVPEAKAVQESLRTGVVTSDDFGELNFVAGIDIGISVSLRRIRACAAVFSFPDIELVESSVACRPLDFPYIPGYLSFREVPGALDALNNLRTRPDFLLVDGHGYAHPRRFGVASHLGVSTGIPSVGIGKSRFIGTYAEPPNVRGAWTPLRDENTSTGNAETIAAVLRTRVGVKPIFVSIGHRVSLGSAVKIALQCTGAFRLPETTRAADRLAARR